MRFGASATWRGDPVSRFCFCRERWKNYLQQQSASGLIDQCTSIQRFQKSISCFGGGKEESEKFDSSTMNACTHIIMIMLFVECKLPSQDRCRRIELGGASNQPPSHPSRSMALEQGVFYLLPIELWSVIISKLDIPSVVSLSSASKHMSRIVEVGRMLKIEKQIVIDFFCLAKSYDFAEDRHLGTLYGGIFIGRVLETSLTAQLSLFTGLSGLLARPELGWEKSSEIHMTTFLVSLTWLVIQTLYSTTANDLIFSSSSKH